MNSNNFDLYYDNPSSRSPNSRRPLNRQPSGQQFESSFAHLPSGLTGSGLYTEVDHMRSGYADMRNTIGGYGGGGGGGGGAGAAGYDMGGQSWNAGAFGQNNTLTGLGGPAMRKPPSRGRAGLPPGWMDQGQQAQMNSFLAGGLGAFGGMRQDTMASEPDEELIPTAIVIKNIPFAIKKEQLVGIMTDMGLPLPYAFNYHFDNGVFRGLAFANFTNPDETATVIDALNHFELNGRKLRVEYKKMLPAAERERIEREKRERRGQLEEQHRPMGGNTLQPQGSMSSLSSRIPAHSPSPVSARNLKPGGGGGAAGAGGAGGGGWNAPMAESPQMNMDVDLNDPQCLQFYSKLLLFKEDQARDLIVFPPTLSPPERRIVHTLAHHMGLGHTSKGEADRRAVNVFKEGSRARISPPMPQIANLQNDQKRGLNRAATTDFSDMRGGDNYYAAGGRQQTAGYLGGYDAAGGLGAGNSLRAAKSFADLRSYTPSPVPSTASFPAALSNPAGRLPEFARDNTQSTTPTLMTPTSGLAERGENALINGLGNMTLGAGFGGSPHGLRGLPSWDRENPGPIGSNRSFSTNFEDRSQSRIMAQGGGPERQPRGPLPERGGGFPRPRQNGHTARNSDELSQQSSAPEITVEH